MVASAGEEKNPARRGQAVRWGILFGVLLLAFCGTVVTVNSTLYSASGFVSSYLNALSRHDLAGALAMPGVKVPADAARDLLTQDAMGGLSSHTLVADTTAPDGRHELVMHVQFVKNIDAEITFLVKHTGPRMGIFSGWEFVRSPVGVLEATPLHDAAFTVNGAAVVSTDGANQPARFAVMTPGIYTLAHESTYLAGEKATFLASDSAAVTQAEVDIQASPKFVTEVNVQLADYLDACASQQVLKPTGCPFGQSISDRIEGLPVWSIALYPEVDIVPGDSGGTWLVPPTMAAAHLTVDVRSLFDGSVSVLDEDVPFTIEYTITLSGDGSLQLTPR